jgi:hypothetical protein
MTETRIPGAITGALPAQPVRPARADRQTRDRRGPDPEQERQPSLPGGGRAPSDPKGAVTILGPEDGDAHLIDEYG